MQPHIPKLSAVLITFNEERRIAATLRALDFCDEIVVVDSGSTDKTETLCKKYNARFFVRPFDGDGPQKRYAISCAKNDWVFVVDADEVASSLLRSEIKTLVKNNMGDCNGYYVPISLLFLGRVLKHGGEFKKVHMRLFNRTHGNFNTNFVYGGASVQGNTGRLSNHLLHDSYTSIHDYFTKFNDYTTAAAQSLMQRNRKFAALNVFVRFPLTFIKTYIIKGCFLDGYPGFVWSLFSSFYAVVKFVKLHEMRQKKALTESGELLS
jgi:glycosyltransferase involved in cell wall biosynthesis